MIVVVNFQGKRGNNVLRKEIIIERIIESGVVAVIRAENSEQAFKLAEACIEGGIAAIELTFTVPGAEQVIKDLAERYQDGEIIIGAGTVLDPETARTAILAGAQFIVSPGLNLETIKLCNRYRIAVMPGVGTTTEALMAMEAGADILKAFPGNVLSPSFIKSVRGPLPHALMMPTGGVSLDNVEAWIKAGAVAVGTGSSLTKGAKTGDYDLVAKTAKEFVQAVKDARA